MSNIRAAAEIMWTAGWSTPYGRYSVMRDRPAPGVARSVVVLEHSTFTEALAAACHISKRDVLVWWSPDATAASSYIYKLVSPDGFDVADIKVGVIHA